MNREPASFQQCTLFDKARTYLPLHTLTWDSTLGISISGTGADCSAAGKGGAWGAVSIGGAAVAGACGGGTALADAVVCNLFPAWLVG